MRIAIDDFGTGYSSLSYLRQFPIDILKIDKSFTDTIIDRSQIPPIVHGLLGLAKTLRMSTVAEGIESEVQRDSLRDQGCEFGQGYLFAKPLDADDVVNLLARRTNRAASACTDRSVTMAGNQGVVGYRSYAIADDPVTLGRRRAPRDRCTTIAARCADRSPAGYGGDDLRLRARARNRCRVRAHEHGGTPSAT